MASIYSFDSLVQSAFDELKANPALETTQAAQNLKAKASPNWLTRLLFWLTPTASIDRRIQNAVQTAKDAIRGFSARLEHVRGEDGRIQENGKYSPFFEEFANQRQLHAGSTPVKMGRCWAEYLGPEIRESDLKKLAMRWRAERERLPKPQSVDDELAILKGNGKDYPRGLLKKLFPKVWAEIVRGFPNEAAAEEALEAFLARPANAERSFYEKIQFFFADKLKTQMQEKGFPDPKIRQILHQAIEAQIGAKSAHPIRAAVQTVAMNLPSYQLELEMETLAQDQALLSAQRSSAENLAYFRERYPQIWQQAILPRFNDDEDAASAALLEIIAGTNTDIGAFAQYIAFFKTMAESDPPRDISEERTQMKSICQFQTTAGLSSFLKAAFPRVWASIANDETAERAFQDWSLLPDNAPLSCYDKTASYLLRKFKTQLAEMGLPAHRIEAIAAEALASAQTLTHPVFGALDRMKEEIPYYLCEAELRRLRKDPSFSAREKSGQELLDLFKTRYPAIWVRMILPAFTRTSIAEEVYKSFLGTSKPDGDGTFHAVLTTYQDAARKRLEQKGFTEPQTDALVKAARTQCSRADLPQFEAIRLIDKNLDKLDPNPRAVQTVFAPLRNDPMLPRIVAALDQPDDQIPDDVIQAAFDLSEAIKRQGAALSRYLNGSLHSAHLEESVRSCLSRRDRLRELAHIHLGEQFYRSMQNREATQPEEELSLDPSQIQSGNIPPYSRLTEDLRRAPDVQFNGTMYLLRKQRDFNKFLSDVYTYLTRTRRFGEAAAKDALLGIQLALCRDYSTKFSDVFAQPWAEQPNGDTLVTGNMDFIDLEFCPQEEQTGPRVEFGLSYVGEIQLIDPQTIGAPPIAFEEVVVNYAFTQTEAGWLRSEPLWDLASDPQIRDEDSSQLELIEEDPRAEEIEKHLEDRDVDRALERERPGQSDKIAGGQPAAVEEVV